MQRRKCYTRRTISRGNARRSYTCSDLYFTHVSVASRSGSGPAMTCCRFDRCNRSHVSKQTVPQAVIIQATSCGCKPEYMTESSDEQLLLLLQRPHHLFRHSKNGSHDRHRRQCEPLCQRDVLHAIGFVYLEPNESLVLGCVFDVMTGVVGKHGRVASLRRNKRLALYPRRSVKRVRASDTYLEIERPRTGSSHIHACSGLALVEVQPLFRLQSENKSATDPSIRRGFDSHLDANVAL